MESDRLKQVLEAALLAAGRPLSLADLESLFADTEAAPGRAAIRAALGELADDWQGRSLALQQVASGYRAQVRAEFEPWLSRLWEEKPPRYSRALLETLAVIAYRQPITRPEIEEIRGVSISTQIMRTLQEREWVRVVGHRDAPGKPAMYGTTRQFLDYFNLRSLDQLPPIAEIRDLDSEYPELALEDTAAKEAGAHREVVADRGGAETGPGTAAPATAGDAEEAEEPEAAAESEDGAGAEGTDDTEAAAPAGTAEDPDDPDDPEESTCTPAS